MLTFIHSYIHSFIHLILLGMIVALRRLSRHVVTRLVMSDTPSRLKRGNFDVGIIRPDLWLCRYFGA